MDAGSTKVLMEMSAELAVLSAKNVANIASNRFKAMRAKKQ